MSHHWLNVRTTAVLLCIALLSSMLVVPLSDSTPSSPTLVEASTADFGDRSVAYSWYDFFEIPYGEWWEYRVDWYGIDVPTTDSYPYLNRHFYNESSFDTFSGARLNVTARSLPEVNMNESPVFLPLLSGEADPGGGTAVIDWYMQYLTWQEYLDRGYPVPMTPFMDGWVVSLNGTVTLDEASAISVMDITSEDFDDFETWSAGNSSDFEMDYISWLLYEGNDRLDIFCMYDYNFVPLYIRILAEKVGEEIVLTYDALGWGIEALMTRWLRDAFMPTEWWFEDFSMHAEIGPDRADLDIDTAVQFAVKAWETNEDGAPCWTWQGMLQDHIASSGGHPVSDFDPYSDLAHVCHSAGSSANGLMVPYEYTPGCFNLSEDETLSFTFPEADILFLEHVGPGITNNITGPAIVRCSEPDPAEIGGDSECSPPTRVLTFNGPADFWTWSQEQDEHENLSAEWDRVGLLPYGMPYIEISCWGPDTPPLALIEAELRPDATTAAQYLLDASLSCDSEDALEVLQFRWDFEADDSWDTDWALEPTVEHDFGVEGVFDVRVEVKDTDGMTDTSLLEIAITDLDPPVTGVSVAGEEGESGWYVSAVKVSLSAEDEAGIEATFYKLDEGAWKEYGGQFGVSSDGLHTVEFYSVDGECNHEAAQETTVKIDATAPTVSFVTDESVYDTDEVTVFWICSDAMSGLQLSTISIDNGVPESAGSEMSYTFSDLSDGTHIARLVVYDNAGNSATAQYFFTVETPAESQGDILVYAAVVAGVVAALAVAAVLLSRRRKG